MDGFGLCVMGGGGQIGGRGHGLFVCVYVCVFSEDWRALKQALEKQKKIRKKKHKKTNEARGLRTRGKDHLPLLK